VTEFVRKENNKWTMGQSLRKPETKAKIEAQASEELSRSFKQLPYTGGAHTPFSEMEQILHQTIKERKTSIVGALYCDTGNENKVSSSPAKINAKKFLEAMNCLLKY
jgi:hypothetical protein